MQPINFVRTIDWIVNVIPESLRKVLFDDNDEVRMRMVRDVDGKEKDSVLKEAMSAFVDLSAVQNILKGNQFAIEIFQHFGLSDLILENVNDSFVKPLIDNLNGDKDSFNRFIFSLNYQYSIKWRSMLVSQKAVLGLLVPKQVYSEVDFDENLTLEWKYPEDEEPTIESVISTLESANKLYHSIAAAHGFPDPEPLKIYYLTSGSNFGIHLKGMGEPIKQLKLLLLEGFHALRQAKFNNTTDRHASVKSALSTLVEVEKAAEANGISHEQARQIKAVIVKEVLGIYDERVLIREVPDNETISNLDGLPPVPQIYALPAGPETEGEIIEDSEGETEIPAKGKPKPRQTRRSATPETPEQPPAKPRRSRKVTPPEEAAAPKTRGARTPAAPAKKPASKSRTKS